MKILIIEDEKILSDTIKDVLNEDYEIEQAYDGKEGEKFAKKGKYDAIVLDLMLPIYDGYTVLEKIRNSMLFTPVLILTAKDSLEDKLKGFNLKADDYLTKPFAKEELKARIEAIIRRNNPNYKKEIKFNNLIVNIKKRKAFINEKELKIQEKQFDMLIYLLEYQNRIITKEQIFDKVWGFNSDTTVNVVESYANEIRQELKKYDYDKYFRTIKGVGYMISRKEEKYNEWRKKGKNTAY